jgi:oxygen-dependent protoporphyrinogen oxidase
MAKDVQAALGVSGAQRALQDLDLPMGRLRAGITVGELGRQRLGDVAVDRLMAPALSASFGRPVDDLPLDAIAPGLAAEVESHGGLIAAARARQATVTKGPAIQSIRGGMYRLTEALAADAARHGAQLLTNRRVQRVVPGASGWRVRCDDQTLEADAVVLAVPRHVLPALLPADAVDAVDAVDASADAPVAAAWVSVVTLVVNSRALDTAPRGVGVLVRPGMTSVTTAVTHLTHSTAKWEWLDDLAGGRHVLRLSYAVTEPSLDMTGHALADACALLGVGIPDSAVLGVATTVWPDSSPVRVENLEPLPGITLVGSAAGKSGLAAIAAQDATLR